MDFLTMSLLLLLFSSFMFFDLSQSQPIFAPAPAPSSLGCNGIYLSYTLDSRKKIRPFTKDPAEQPFAFEAYANVINSETTQLLAWSLLIEFQYQELIVSIDGAVLTDGSEFPYNTTSANTTSFSGYPNTDLKTPIETAGDSDLFSANITIVGTLFGSPPPNVPLPASLALDDPSYICPPVTKDSKYATTVYTCCIPDPEFVPNITANGTDFNSPSNFLPRRKGDLTIDWDVIQSYQSSYLALVTMANHNPLGRLDHWHLSWEWQRGEFIYKLRGAYPTEIDVSGCVFGKAAQYYQNLDFSTVMNCDKNPTLIDLPRERYNDSQMGLIQYCCRNGTILPVEMDASQSKSAFQINVFKLPPDVNQTKLYPPSNFKIQGELNPDYKCGQPMRVSPKVFPDPSGLDSETLAIASWQVVCNITRPKGASPKCCVSYSAFYNDSVIPCKTCACGCSSSVAQSCSTTAEAMILPPDAILQPFDNRTKKALAWAEIKHLNVPKPLPCGDYCGVSINWHIATDYKKGWSARVTLFNWEEDNLADWFVAVTMDKAYLGYEKMYSFNGTSMGNNTIFMQGLPGLNYLMGETNSTDGSLNAGKQQSVISFTKSLTPGINIIAGDGFPSKLYFNGEECAMPDIIPTSSGFRNYALSFAASTLLFVALSLVFLEL